MQIAMHAKRDQLFELNLKVDVQDYEESRRQQIGGGEVSAAVIICAHCLNHRE